LRHFSVEELMTKSSTVTHRAEPVQGVSAASGGFVVRAETLTIQTGERVELSDITGRVMALAHQAGIREGIVSLWSLHTTCAVFVNEAQPALHADIKRVLETMVARDAEWLHNDPEHSDCDRVNADSHLRAMLLGHSLTLQISGGEIVLGQWQRILMAELDGPRARTLRVQVMGV
jgi:secondary thiamine-phosphate synthase enzyme